MEYTKIDFTLLQKYESFSSLEELDKNIYLHIDRLVESDVPSSVVEVLRFFGRSSLRICGVSFAKYQTIADALNVSKRTVLRAVKTLVGFGAINRIPTLKGWRRSVNVVQILPVSLQGVTPTEAHEGNGEAASGDEIKSESFSFNHSKQEKHIINDNQSIGFNSIVRMITLKVADKVKNGLQIESLSSYCEKVVSNEIRLSAARKRQEDRKKAKEDQARAKFEDFVWKRYGATWDDLGAYCQDEALRLYREAMNPKPKPVPFYNWLQA